MRFGADGCAVDSQQPGGGGPQEAREAALGLHARVQLDALLGLKLVAARDLRLAVGR